MDERMPKLHVLDVTTINGVPMRVVAYPAGADTPALALSEHGQVEFYDRRHDHTPHGQRIAGYRLDSLLDEPPRGGLNLHGGVDDWRIDARTYEIVDRWLVSLPIGCHLCGARPAMPCAIDCRSEPGSDEPPLSGAAIARHAVDGSRAVQEAYGEYRAALAERAAAARTNREDALDRLFGTAGSDGPDVRRG